MRTDMAAIGLGASCFCINRPFSLSQKWCLRAANAAAGTHPALARRRRARISKLFCCTVSRLAFSLDRIIFVTLLRRIPIRNMMTKMGMSTQSRIDGSSTRSG